MKHWKITGVSILCGLSLFGCTQGGAGNSTSNSTTAQNTTATNTTGTDTVASTPGSTTGTVAGTPGSTMNTSGSPTALDDDDREFMQKAAEGGLAEVAMGKLASTKATDAEVKSFGQMMADDHGKANAALKELAAKKGFVLPTEPSSAHKDTMGELEKVSGADFDKEYVSEMIEDHEKDVKEFEETSKDAEDPDVKAFAAQTLPTLQTHLEQIRKIGERMGVKGD
jgi:putative membrane protein